MKNVSLNIKDFIIKQAVISGEEYYCIEFPYNLQKRYLNVEIFEKNGKIQGLELSNPKFRECCLLEFMEDAEEILSKIKLPKKQKKSKIEWSYESNKSFDGKPYENIYKQSHNLEKKLEKKYINLMKEHDKLFNNKLDKYQYSYEESSSSILDDFMDMVIDFVDNFKSKHFPSLKTFFVNMKNKVSDWLESDKNCSGK